MDTTGPVVAARRAIEELLLAGLDAPAAAESAARAAAAIEAAGIEASAQAWRGEGRPEPETVLAALAAISARLREVPPPGPAPESEVDPTTTLDRLDAVLLGAGDDRRLAEADRDLLRAHPARAAERRAAALRDPAALLRMVVGGTTAERRAAVRRLEEFLRSDGRGFDAADRREVAETLEGHRDGAVGRTIDEARARLGRAQKTLERLEAAVRRYWEGETATDPVLDLDEADLATLGTYLTDAAEVVAAHLSDLLRRLAAERRADDLERLVSAVRLGADERLVPALVGVVQDAHPAGRVQAARALSVIDDPRIVLALRKAFRHAGTPAEKLALAGSLAAHGDRRGVGVVLDHLTPEQPPTLLELALEAMAAIGEPAHLPRVLPFLSQKRTSVARAAAAAIEAFGDRSALDALAATVARPDLAAAVQRAVVSIRARLDPGDSAAGTSPALRSPDVGRPPRARWTSRLVGRLYYLLGLFWSLVRRRRAALGAFQAAGSNNPYLLGPWLARARIMLRAGRLAESVDALRAALRVRAASVLATPDRANFVIRVYVRHADACAQAGEATRALDALDELFGHDLRFADVDLRLEAQQRREFAARAGAREG
jgi:tetratricopeptide (TPR) repeat protein